VTSAELKRRLGKRRAARFAPGKRRPPEGVPQSEAVGSFPMHGAGKDLPRALVHAVLKQLGLKWRQKKTCCDTPFKLAVDDTGAVSVFLSGRAEAHTFGEDESEALAAGPWDALETALSMYVDGRQAIPAPSRLKRRQKAVALPLADGGETGVCTRR